MKEIIIETQDSYYNYISNVSNGCQFISDKIREGNLSIAISSIMDFSEGLSWVLNVERQMEVHQYFIKSATIKVAEFLTQINEAMEHEDYVLIADMFEYEIQPIFEEAKDWKFQKNK